METQRDRLIRQGLLTPFGSLAGFERRAVGAGGAGGGASGAGGGGGPEGTAAATAAAAAGGRGGPGAAGAAGAGAPAQQAGPAAAAPARHAPLPNPFSRAPLGAELLESRGRAGKPLRQLVAEAGEKTRALREGRPTTKELRPGEVPRQVRRRRGRWGRTVLRAW